MQHSTCACCLLKRQMKTETSSEIDTILMDEIYSLLCKRQKKKTNQQQQQSKHRNTNILVLCVNAYFVAIEARARNILMNDHTPTTLTTRLSRAFNQFILSHSWTNLFTFVRK